ncbi:MAG: type IV toxin-antitoxin system AbiEi family antitoxin domain-containing protein [Candidatus Eisenbacteria bacterium]|nr:type IV toxin-antitoxin system AbiEi family antitoxin domain-containing protein [Candidatus Eisenbacteria bacterium]
MTRTDRDKLVQMARKRGVLRAADAKAAGYHSQQLTRLVADRVLERIAPGCYLYADRPITENHGIVTVAAAAPGGVICLLSALSFHGIGTQLPSDVWLAIERGTRVPVFAWPPVTVLRFSGPAFSEGIESHRIAGVNVRVYSVAKTLADSFRFRNRIGLDVALEALREAWRERRFTVTSLEHAARACRVERVMRPYVEAVVG